MSPSAQALLDPCSPLLGINTCTGIDCSFKYAVQDTISLPVVTQLPTTFDLNDSNLVPADACIPSGTKFSITGFSSDGYQFDYQAINVVPNTLNQILKPSEMLQKNNVEKVTVTNTYESESGRNPSSSNHSGSPNGGDYRPTSGSAQGLQSSGRATTFLMGANHSMTGFVADKIDPIPLVNQQRAISASGSGITIPIVRWMSSSASHCNVQLLDSPQDKVGANESLITYAVTNPAGSCDSVKSSSTCFPAVAPYFNSRPDIVGGPRPGFLATGSSSVAPKQYSKCSNGCDTGSQNFGWLKNSDGRDFYKRSAFDCSKEKLARTCQNGSLAPQSSDYVVSFDQCVSTCKPGGTQISLPSGVASGSRCQLPLPADATATIAATSECCSGVAERICNSLDGSEEITYRCSGGGSPPSPDCTGGLISWTDQSTGKTCQGSRPTTPSGRSTGSILSTTAGLNGQVAFACNASGAWEQTGAATCGSATVAPTCAGSFKWKQTCLNQTCAGHPLSNSMSSQQTSGNFSKCLYSGGASQQAPTSATVSPTACSAAQAGSVALCTLVSVSSQAAWGGGYTVGHVCECDQQAPAPVEQCVPRPTGETPSTTSAELFSIPVLGTVNNNEELRWQCESTCGSGESQDGACLADCGTKYPFVRFLAQTPQNVGGASSQFGGNGGGAFSFECPDGKFATSIHGKSGAHLDSFQLTCEGGSTSAKAGGNGGGNHSLSCPAGKRFVGFRGRSGGLIDHLAGYCGDANSKAATFVGETNSSWGGGEFVFSCPIGSYVYRVDGRSGDRVDALKFFCKTETSKGVYVLPDFGSENNNDALRSQCQMQCPSPKEGGNDCRHACVQKFPSARYLGQPAGDVGLQSNQVGGGGGSAFTLTCPDGKYATKITGRSGARVDALQLHCEDGSSSRSVGGGGGGPFTMSCGSGQYLSGFRGRSGSLIDHLAGYCATGDSNVSSLAGATSSDWGGGEFVFSCPVGSHVYQISGRSGNEIDALKFYCRPVSKPVELQPGVNYCPEEVAPVQNECGDVAGQFIVRNVVTSRSNSQHRVMVTQKVHLESYCSDNIHNPPPADQKTVKWMLDYSLYGICGLPAMPNWYDGGRWVGNNFPNYNIDGYYTVVKTINPTYQHGHTRMDDFLSKNGVTFVQGSGETFDSSKLLICNRPPMTGGGGGGGGGGRNYNVHQN